ncbi:MAG: arsenic resistance protein [Bacteroidetes bacterium]|nr:arsenic resistance protein [Bacteroidota bacterium]
MLPEIQKLTSFVQTHLTKLILSVMILGVANSYFFGGIPFNLGICAAASFLMIYPMFINLRIEDMMEMGQHRVPVVLSVLINFIFSPALAWGLGYFLLPGEPYLALGLMLISLIPTSGMTATWTERSGGNLKAALSIIAVSLFLVILLLPVALPVFAGNLLEAGPWFIFQRILLVIIIPLILGDLTRRYLVKKNGQEGFKKLKPLFSGLSSMGLLLVLFLIMSLDANRQLAENPVLVVKTLIPLLIYYLVLFTVSTILTKSLPYPSRIAVVFGTSVRYLALGLGIAVPLLGTGSESSQVVLAIALAFFVQVPASSFYSKWAIASLKPKS